MTGTDARRTSRPPGSCGARPRRSSSRSTRPTTRSASSKAPNSTPLGWEETYAISASHGRGTGDLLDAIVWALPPESEAELARKAREAEAEAWADEVAAGHLEPFVVGDPEAGDADDSDGVEGARSRRRRCRGRPLGRRDGRREGRRAGRDRLRRAPERRQVEPAQRAPRRGPGDRLRGARARPATRSTRGSPGVAARSCSSTPPASGAAARSPAARPPSATRPFGRSMRCRARTSRSSSSTPSRA